MIDYLIHDETGNTILWLLISGTVAGLFFLRTLQKLKKTHQIGISKIILSIIFSILAGQAIYWFIAVPVLIMIFGL